jgi:hypothetical protein
MSPTIFTCRCCPASVAGTTNGDVAATGWRRIEGIDGPDAICPACVADPAVLDDLRADGYEPQIGDACAVIGEPASWAMGIASAYHSRAHDGSHYGAVVDLAKILEHVASRDIAGALAVVAA